VLVAPTTAPPPRRRETDEGDLRRAAPDRKAVFVSINIEDGRALIEDLGDALWKTEAGAFAGFTGGFDEPTLWLFYGPEGRQMVEIIRAVPERLGRRALLVRRPGSTRRRCSSRT
jgi:hypothetical protein